MMREFIWNEEFITEFEPRFVLWLSCSFTNERPAKELVAGGAKLRGYPLIVILTIGPSYSRDYWLRAAIELLNGFAFEMPKDASELFESSFLSTCLVTSFLLSKPGVELVKESRSLRDLRSFPPPLAFLFLIGVSCLRLSMSPALSTSSKSETQVSAKFFRSGVGS